MFCGGSVLLRWVVDLIVLLWHIGVGVASVDWSLWLFVCLLLVWFVSCFVACEVCFVAYWIGVY